MQCTDPKRIFKNLDRNKYPDGLRIPCGRCLSCRIKKRSEWSMRMLHEFDYHDDTLYLTLTYNDENIPDCESLQKKELQKFFKRLRKSTQKKFKYFACGEYGGKLNRPHYHAIIFGLSKKNPDDVNNIINAWPYCDWHNNNIFNGSLRLVTPESIRYVAKYMDKKLSGDMLEEVYIANGLENQFALMSKGIGLNYCLDNGLKIAEKGYLTLNGNKVSIPRYYLNKLDIDSSKMKNHSIEKDIKTVKKFTGLDGITSDLLYRENSKKFIEYDKKIKKSRLQSDKNIQAKLNLKQLKKDRFSERKMISLSGGHQKNIKNTEKSE